MELIKEQENLMDLAHEAFFEARRAADLFAPFNSAHEGYAIILEELEELKDWVFMKQSKRDPNEMKKEAIQLAAMALRFVHDLHHTDYRK